MTEQVTEIPDIGPVLIKISPKASRISIKLKPFEGVVLVLPRHVKPAEGLRFVMEKKDWILQHLHTLEEKESKLTIFNEHTEFKSRSFALRIVKQVRNDVRLQLNNGILLVSVITSYSIHYTKLYDKLIGSRAS